MVVVVVVAVLLLLLRVIVLVLVSSIVEVNILKIISTTTVSEFLKSLCAFLQRKPHGSSSPHINKIYRFGNYPTKVVILYTEALPLVGAKFP